MVRLGGAAGAGDAFLYEPARRFRFHLSRANLLQTAAEPAFGCGAPGLPGGEISGVCPVPLMAGDSDGGSGRREPCGGARLALPFYSGRGFRSIEPLGVVV